MNNQSTSEKDFEAKMKQQIKEHNDSGKDFIEYLKKHNRHTLKISLLNEQSGQEEWKGKTITFYNEDNAISHLGLLEKFFELLLENKDWGFNHTPDEVVENILNPLKERIQPPSKEKVKE